MHLPFGNRKCVNLAPKPDRSPFGVPAVALIADGHRKMDGVSAGAAEAKRKFSALGSLEEALAVRIACDRQRSLGRYSRHASARRMSALVAIGSPPVTRHVWAP